MKLLIEKCVFVLGDGLVIVMVLKQMYLYEQNRSLVYKKRCLVTSVTIWSCVPPCFPLCIFGNAIKLSIEV